jgi:hypothetical protein
MARMTYPGVDESLGRLRCAGWSVGGCRTAALSVSAAATSKLWPGFAAAQVPANTWVDVIAARTT